MAVNDPGEQREGSDAESRALATLAEAVDAVERDFLAALLVSRLLEAWRPRLMIGFGTVLVVASLAAMYEEMSGHLTYAVAAEGVLACAVLLVAHGIRGCWLRRHPELLGGAGPRRSR